MAGFLGKLFGGGPVSERTRSREEAAWRERTRRERTMREQARRRAHFLGGKKHRATHWRRLYEMAGNGGPLSERLRMRERRHALHRFGR